MKMFESTFPHGDKGDYSSGLPRRPAMMPRSPHKERSSNKFTTKRSKYYFTNLKRIKLDYYSKVDKLMEELEAELKSSGA